MKTWQAILLTLGIVVVCLIIEPKIIPLMVLGTSLWVAIDSRKVGLGKYKCCSAISTNLVALFIECYFFWAIVFPWYLSKRYKIKNNLAQLKEGKK